MTREQIIYEIRKAKPYYNLEHRSTEQLLAMLRTLEDANRRRYAEFNKGE